MLENAMPEKEFNLLYEPWIKVMLTDGSIQEVSLLVSFAKAAHFYMV